MVSVCFFFFFTLVFNILPSFCFPTSTNLERYENRDRQCTVSPEGGSWWGVGGGEMTHLDVVHMEICGVVLSLNKLQVRTAGSARCACGPLQACCVMTPTPTVTGQSRTPGIFFFCFPPPTLKGGGGGEVGKD